MNGGLPALLLACGLALPAAGQSVAVTTITVNLLEYQFLGEPDPSGVAKINEDAWFGPDHSVASYYREVSYGRLVLTGHAYVVKSNVARPADLCTKGPTTYAAPGQTFPRAAKTFFLLDCNVHYATAGGGIVPHGGGSKSAHEFGHSLGMNHAGLYNCSGASGVQPLGPFVPDGQAFCSADVYGDPYDVMAHGGGHFSAYLKLITGMMDPARVREVGAPFSGVARLDPLELPSAGTQALKLYSQFGPLYVEYRRKLGADSSLPAEGVQIRLQATLGDSLLGPTSTLLLKAGPAGATILAAGQQFDDAYDDLHVKVLSLDAAAASLAVWYGPTPPVVGPDVTPPTVRWLSPAAGAAVSGVVSLAADASDDVGVSKVEFYDGPALLGTSATMPYRLDWDTRGKPEGPHALLAKAYDGAGNAQTAPLALTVANDQKPPSVTVHAPGPGAQLAPGRYRVLVEASDDVGVTKLELYDGSTLVRTAAP